MELLHRFTHFGNFKGRTPVSSSPKGKNGTCRFQISIPYNVKPGFIQPEKRGKSFDPLPLQKAVSSGSLFVKMCKSWLQDRCDYIKNKLL